MEGATPAALERLAGHAWPGNLWELQTVLTGAIVVRARGWLQPEDFHFDPMPDREAAETRPTTEGSTDAALERMARRDTALRLAAQPRGISSGHLARQFGLSPEQGRRDLVALAREGRLRRIGAGRSARYVLA